MLVSIFDLCIFMKLIFVLSLFTKFYITIKKWYYFYYFSGYSDHTGLLANC